jgi:hypothetical protein
MASDSESDSNFDPRRRLCPDGSCIGIMAADGKCTVCGRGDSGQAGTPAPTPGMREDSDDDVEAPRSEPGSEDQSSEFDPNRRLCSDDTCVGVLGEDNRCRLCGKPAAA